MRHRSGLILFLLVTLLLAACQGAVNERAEEAAAGEGEAVGAEQEAEAEEPEEAEAEAEAEPEAEEEAAEAEGPASACGEVDTSGPMDEVTLRLSWRWKAEFAPIVLTDDEGFFEEQHIDVELLEGQGSGEGVTLIGNKTDDFGYLAIPTIAIGISKGVPIQVVSALMAKHPSALAFYESQGIEEPKDLEGKSIALSAGEAFTVLWPSFAERWDIDTDAVQQVQLDPGIKSQAFLDGDIDVIPVFVNNELPQLRNTADEPVGALLVSEWGFNSLANGIVTHEDMISENPGLVCRFVAALAKGYAYSQENPEEALDAVLARSEELASQPREVLLEQVALTLELVSSPNAEGMPIGWMADEDWNATVDPLVETGAMEDRPANDAFYTNEFITEQTE